MIFLLRASFSGEAVRFGRSLAEDLRYRRESALLLGKGGLLKRLAEL
jgi:hypothetical protein